MFLVIDVGNTNIVAGVYDGKELLTHWRFSSDRSKTADEFGISLCSMFNYTHMDTSLIDSIIISSVVPPLTVPLCRMCERYFNCTPLVVSADMKLNFQLNYDNPKEIGADRIVNAVAAYEKYKDKGNLIIIDFGTATTFCALATGGKYLGGAIAPGIGTSTEALTAKASLLPRIEISRPDNVICRNTVQAMKSGVLYGFVGQMKEMVSRMKAELGGQAFVIVTGGFGGTMAAESDVVDVVEPFLTLEGLRILHEMNN